VVALILSSILILFILFHFLFFQFHLSLLLLPVGPNSLLLLSVLTLFFSYNKLCFSGDFQVLQMVSLDMILEMDYVFTVSLK
jgi:hypothetical protein